MTVIPCLPVFRHSFLVAPPSENAEAMEHRALRPNDPYLSTKAGHLQVQWQSLLDAAAELSACLLGHCPEYDLATH